MKIKKILSSVLAACVLLVFTACSETTKDTQVLSTTATTIASERSETLTEEFLETIIEEDTPIEIEEDLVLGNYTWNPYVWSDSLTDSFGETTRDTMFNCISAVMNGDDSFEYYEEQDMNIFYYLNSIICPYLSEIITLPPVTENGVATLEYICSKEEAKTIIDDFGKEVESILNESIKESDSDEVKLMMIEYNFSKTLSYDYDYINTHPTTYEAIIDRYGICQSFSEALVHLYLQAGIDAYLTKAHTPELNHMFVYMTLNGEEFFIEPTWECSRNGTGLSYFGVNADFYSQNDVTIDTLYLMNNENFDGNPSSEKYKPLWQMKEIKSITREDGKLVIEFVNASGEDDTFIVDN